jgi:hypothetical protein
MNLNFKEISSWELSKNFYNTWLDVFNYINDNNSKFYIYHDFLDGKRFRLEFPKCNNINPMLPNIKLLGYMLDITDDNMEDTIFDIKYKRSHGKKYLTDIRYLDITYTNKKKPTPYSEWYKPRNLFANSVGIPYTYYNSTNIDDYINSFEKLFDSNFTKNDKKRLVRAINRWYKYKNEHKVVDFWKVVNKIFIIKFKINYPYNSKLEKNNTFNNTTIEEIIHINTVEKYDMIKKCEVYNEKQRLKRIEERKLKQQSNNIE